MEENNISLGDIMAVLKRRKLAYTLPLLLITTLSVALAFLLPPVYRSSSTILIEQREIPSEFVTSSITTFAEQRIQSIHARILTATKLLELIDKFGLYADLRDKKTTDEIIEKMKEDIHLTPVNVEITDRRRGMTATATIAFTLSYEGENPTKVQQVTSTITSLFLREDIKVRKEQSSSAYDFLSTESQKVTAQISELEKKISAFKKENVEALPELFQLNRQTLDNIERNIEHHKSNLSALKEKRDEMEEELNNLPRYMEETELLRGQKYQDEKRLEMLEMELISLKTKFSDRYPDVIKLTEEIQNLKQKVKTSRAEDEKKEKQKNPAYVTLSSRLAGLRSDIASTRDQIAEMETRAEEYRQRLAITPKVEEKYNALASEKRNLYLKATDLQAKMMEARVAKEFDSKQKGERFSLVEAARFPEKPYKPNRIAIVLIGMVLGLGAGVGMAALMEFSDSSFRKSQALTSLTGFPVLAEIPVIVTREDRKKQVRRRLVFALGGITLAVLSVFLFDQFIMDLDVLQAKIIRNLS